MTAIRRSPSMTFAPRSRTFRTAQTEIELATALAQAGKDQEATAYFTTLRESAPGDGTINLELARLAARAGNESEAILYYQSALDGTWQGNGYDRRRQVRLEMARYLISRREYNQARNQLLIAAGNAPDEPDIKLEIAGLLEQANAPRDALSIYQILVARRDPPFAALEGAGRTAFSLGMYRLAGEYLEPGPLQPPCCETPGERGGGRPLHAGYLAACAVALSLLLSFASPTGAKCP